MLLSEFININSRLDTENINNMVLFFIEIYYDMGNRDRQKKKTEIEVKREEGERESAKIVF